MGFPARWTTISGGSGNLNGVTSGTTTPGTTIPTADIAPNSLSLLSAVTAATSTITLTPKIQVSHDNSTWYDAATGLADATATVEATGTATIVNRVFDVPSALYVGWQYIRAAVVNGVTTGASGDLYAFTFQYRKFSAFS
jgi:hypothetical protein